MTSLHVICGLPPPNSKAWLRLCIKPCAMRLPDSGRCISVLLRAPSQVVAYNIAKVQNILNFCKQKLIFRSCTATNIRNFNNSVFMSKTRETYNAGLFRLQPTTAEKSIYSNKCYYRHATRILLRGVSKKKPISGRVDRASATEAVDSGSIPGRVNQRL